MSITRPRRSVIVTASAVAIAALALAGCSSTNAGTTAQSGSTADIAAGSEGTVDQFHDIASVCGDKKVTVGVVDGYGTNSWSKTVKAEIESEAAKCPAITSVTYAAGRGDLQATTSAITSMAAKGTNIILVIPDAGPGQAHDQAMATATKAGSTVVAFASDPAGTVGTDYVDYTDQLPVESGKAWAQWVVDQLGSAGGNAVFLGGPAGVAVSAQELQGVQEVLKDNPQVKLLTGDTPVVTNWDPAAAQKAMSGLLSQYPKIDAVIADYGASASGVIRAYQAAGLSIPLLTSTDDNSLSCGYDDLKKTNPDYQLATVTSRTWIGRVALRKALAVQEGKSDTEPSMYKFSLFEDSTGKAAGSKLPSAACLTDAPSDASPSSLLTSDEFAKVFG